MLMRSSSAARSTPWFQRQGCRAGQKVTHLLEAEVGFAWVGFYPETRVIGSGSREWTEGLMPMPVRAVSDSVVYAESEDFVVSGQPPLPGHRCAARVAIDTSSLELSTERIRGESRPTNDHFWPSKAIHRQSSATMKVL